jgi:hypothetical protein
MLNNINIKINLKEEFYWKILVKVYRKEWDNNHFILQDSRII